MISYIIDIYGMAVFLIIAMMVSIPLVYAWYAVTLMFVKGWKHLRRPRSVMS